MPPEFYEFHEDEQQDVTDKAHSKMMAGIAGICLVGLFYVAYLLGVPVP